MKPNTNQLYIHFNLMPQTKYCNSRRKCPLDYNTVVILNIEHDRSMTAKNDMVKLRDLFGKKLNTACVCKYDRVRMFCAAKRTHVYSMHQQYVLQNRVEQHDKIIMIFYFLFLWISFNCAHAMFWILLDFVLDINECLSNPCQNSAVCINLLDSYRCICLAGYNGSHCETDTRVNCATVMRLIPCLCVEREAIMVYWVFYHKITKQRMRNA